MSDASESIDEYLTTTSEDDPEASSLRIPDEHKVEHLGPVSEGDCFSIVCFPIQAQAAAVMTRTDFEACSDAREAFEGGARCWEDLFFGYLDGAGVLTGKQKKRLEDNTRLKFLFWRGRKKALRAKVVVFRDRAAPREEAESYCSLELRDNLRDAHAEGLLNDTNEFLAILQATDALSRAAERGLFNADTLDEKFEYVLAKPRRQREVFPRLAAFAAETPLCDEALRLALQFLAQFDAESLGEAGLAPATQLRLADKAKGLEERGGLADAGAATRKRLFKFFLNCLACSRSGDLDGVFKLVRRALDMHADEKRRKLVLKALKKNAALRSAAAAEGGFLGEDEEDELVSALLHFRAPADFGFVDQLLHWSLPSFFNKKFRKKRHLERVQRFLKFFNGLLEPKEAAQALERVADRLLGMTREADALKLCELLAAARGRDNLVLQLLRFLVLHRDQVSDEQGENAFLAKLVPELAALFGDGGLLGLLRAVERHTEPAEFAARMDRWPVLQRELKACLEVVYRQSEEEAPFWAFLAEVHSLDYFETFLNRPENRGLFRVFVVDLRLRVHCDVRENESRHLHAFFGRCADFGRLSLFFDAYTNFFLSEEPQFAPFADYLRHLAAFLRARGISKTPPAFKDCVERALRHFCREGRLFLALESLQLLQAEEALAPLRKALAKFSLKLADFGDRVFSDAFWHRLLALPPFAQQASAIAFGLGSLNDAFAKQAALGPELDARFFRRFELSGLRPVHAHFQRLRALYEAHLREADDDSAPEYSASESDSEAGSSAPRADAGERALFRVLDLANAFPKFQVLLKVLGLVRSSKMRETLREQERIRPVFDFLAALDKGKSPRLDCLVFAQAFELEPLLQNASLFLDARSQRRTRKKFKAAVSAWTHTAAKVKFASALMQQKLFLRLVRPKFLENERSAIARQLRSEGVAKVKVMYSKASPAFLERGADWFDSKLFDRFLPVFLVTQGFGEAIRGKLLSAEMRAVRALVEAELPPSARRPEGGGTDGKELKYKAGHRLVCTALANFLQLLFGLQSLFGEPGGPAPAARALAELAQEFEVAQWVKDCSFLSLPFVRHLFGAADARELALDPPEKGLLRRTDCLGFVQAFLDVFNQCSRVDRAARAAQALAELLGVEPPRVVRKALKKSAAVQKRFAQGGKGLRDELGAFFGLFGRTKEARLDPGFAEFLLDVAHCQDLRPLLEASACDPRFGARLKDLLEASEPADGERLKALLGLKRVVLFLQRLREEGALEAFLRGGRLADGDLAAHLQRAREQAEFLGKFLGAAQEPRKKTPGLKKQIRAFFRECSAEFSFDAQRRRVRVSLSGGAWTPEHLRELQKKAEIYAKERIYTREGDHELFEKFGRTLKEIWNFQSKLREFLALGLLPSPAFLGAVRVEDAYQDSAQLAQTPGRASLSRRLRVLDSEILANAQTRAGFLAELGRDENFFASLALEKQMVDLSPRRLFHFLRSLRPALERGALEDMVSRHRAESAEHDFQVLLTLQRFFRREQAAFHKAALGLADPLQCAHSLRFCAFSSAEGESEWDALNCFLRRGCPSGVPPLLKFFFCARETAFAQVEPFVLRSFELANEEPFLLVGFSNLRAETQKKVLERFRGRLRDRPANAVLFLDAAAASSAKLRSFFEDILDEVDFDALPPGKPLRPEGVAGRPDAVFTSAESGNGKTFQVLRRLGRAPFECFQLSPSVGDEDLWRRFARLRAEQGPPVGNVVFKVEELADRSPAAAFKLNKLLFVLGHFRVLEFASFLFTFPPGARLFLEVSTSALNRDLAALPALAPFAREDCRFSLDQLEVRPGAPDCQFSALAGHLRSAGSPAPAEPGAVRELLRTEVVKKFPGVAWTFRKLENFVRYVNRQCRALEEVPREKRKFAGKERLLLEYFLKVGLEMVLPSADAKHKQLFARLKFGGLDSDDEPDEPRGAEGAADFFSRIGHAYLFPTQRGLAHFFEQLSPDDAFDRILIQLLELGGAGLVGQANDANQQLQWSERQFLDKLCECLGKSEGQAEELWEQTRAFNGGKGFSLNKDNVFKLLLVHKKLEAGLPVFLMGETGCGKTYLLEYFARVFHAGRVDFETFVLHAGVSEEDLRAFVERKLARAREFLAEQAREGRAEPREVWVFFDEINTSQFEKLLADLIVDRRFFFGAARSGPADFAVPPNLRFLAACNPYRVVAANFDDELECRFELHERREQRLSHRVNPLKLSLLDFVWDYGALPEAVEKEYIRRLLKGAPAQVEQLKEAVFVAHFFVKNEVERNQSSVSLRDIARVNKIFHFCVVFLRGARAPGGAPLDERLAAYERGFRAEPLDPEVFFEALCLTIGVNYYFRLYKQGGLR